MVQYLLWRSMTTHITLSFLVVGHTKFSPDWCFGLVKRLGQKSEAFRRFVHKNQIIGSLLLIKKLWYVKDFNNY